MEHIWAPWRIQYIESNKQEGCILCDNPGKNDDARNYILYRGTKSFIIMNSYPYNPGHLMVVPFRHVDSMEKLTEGERHEHFDIVSQAIRVLKQVFKPAGFNIGINEGKAAGAGIADHFHTHIVPRWEGDTNFMPVLTDVRVLPEALDETYKRLKVKF